MLMNEKEKFYSLHPEMDYDSLLEKVKTDKDFVIAEHRKMWNAIADYSEKYGRCLNTHEYLAFYCKDLAVMLIAGCFLCTYGTHILDKDGKPYRGNKSMCEHCLLQWYNKSGSDFPGGLPCYANSDSIYSLLCLAKDERDVPKYASYARMIANLPINEEVYNDEI